MHKGSKNLTAFSTHNGIYQWNVTSFVLKGALGTFQRTMTEVLWDHFQYTQAHTDDIVVFTKAW